jgi:NAD(P)-dependent dehydrogenase (short-subunit alcohol dehydrogenase family)
VVQLRVSAGEFTGARLRAIAAPGQRTAAFTDTTSEHSSVWGSCSIDAPGHNARADCTRLESETMNTGLFDVRDSYVLVTGGSRGIGLGMARGFVKAGATVLICARNAADCDAAATELASFGRCVSLPADLSSLAGIENLASGVADHAPHLNVLVNNAGATWAEAIDTYPEHAWDDVVDLNMKTPFFLTQRLLPLLRKAASRDNPARVINVGSIAALIPMRDSYAYAASKAGLHHLTLLMARHLAPTVNVNTIAPGAFETRMIEFALRNRAALEAQVPRGTVGQGDDIAGIAICLASRAGAYVTGAVIPVDGGLSLRNP